MLMCTDIVLKNVKLDLKPEDYFSNHLPELMKSKCDYYMIYGERSNGKTYALLKYGIEQKVKHGHDMAYIRRWNEDLRGSKGAAIFSALIANGEIKKITKGKWDTVYFYSMKWYFAKHVKNKKGEDTIVKDSEPFCYAFCLNQWERDKGTSFPHIQNIIFDEFLARSSYLKDEFSNFMNTISTIIRHRGGVKIFMLGNTVNMWCPYFAEMGISNYKKMEQGTFDIYEYGDTELKVGVFWAPDSRQNGKVKPSDKYFAFNNPKLEMIKGGKWEFDIYPHNEWDIKPKYVVFSGYIVFSEEIVQLDVCVHDGMNYAYCHRKTTPIKYPDRDIVFTVDADPRPNWRTGFGNDKVGSNIKWYFNNNKVFYTDNLIGETVRNFREEARC